MECDEQTLTSAITDTFVTSLSDRTAIELKENGSQIRVCWDNRDEYVQLVFDARLHEHDRQIDAIRRGIGNLFVLFSSR